MLKLKRLYAAYAGDTYACSPKAAERRSKASGFFIFFAGQTRAKHTGKAVPQ
jgi:hypothetical protein